MQQINVSRGKFEISAFLQDCRKRREPLVLNSLKKLSQLCDKAEKLKAQIKDINHQDESPQIRAQGLIHSSKVIIKNKQDALNLAIATKETIRQRYGLMREPEIPSVISGVMALAIMIFIESGFSMAFFQNAHMVATPQAALLTALLISATNVIASCCAGFFIGRRLGYGTYAIDADAAHFLNVRRSAKFLMVFFVVAMMFFIVTIGLVRSQETLTEVTHSLSAYLELLHSPEALLLMIASACMSAIAFHKGMKSFSDPHLNYGIYAKNIDDAEDALLDFQEEAFEKIEDVFDDAADVYKRTQKQSNKVIIQYNETVEASCAAYRDLKKIASDAKAKLKTDATRIIESYQETGGKMNDCFDLDAFCRFPEIDQIELPDFYSIPDTEPILQDFNAQKANCLSALEDVFNVEKIDFSQENSDEKTNKKAVA